MSEYIYHPPTWTDAAWIETPCGEPANLMDITEELNRLMRINSFTWIHGDKPDTPKGTETSLWVTLRDRRTNKLSVMLMKYLNAYVMPCHPEGDPPACAIPHNPEEDGYCEEYEWTCWSRGECDICETQWVWDEPHLEIIAHAFVSEPHPYQPEQKNIQ